MPFWALLASGQIAMRKVDGWQTLTPWAMSWLALVTQLGMRRSIEALRVHRFRGSEQGVVIDNDQDYPH